jgi:hypothetical protein
MANIRIGKEVPRGFAASMTAVFAVVAKGSLSVTALVTAAFWSPPCVSIKVPVFPFAFNRRPHAASDSGIGICSPKFSNRSDFWERLAA